MSNHKRHAITATGWVDLNGVWHDLEKAAERKKKRQEDQKKERAKQTVFQIQQDVALALADMERRRQGLYRSDDFSRCPYCLAEDKLDPLQLPYCYNHDWFDDREIEGWLLHSSGKRIGVRLKNFKPPVPSVIVEKPRREQDPITYTDIYISLVEKDVSQASLDEMIAYAENLYFRYECLCALEGQRRFHDFPAEWQTIHYERKAAVKDEYMKLREIIHAIRVRAEEENHSRWIEKKPKIDPATES